MKELWAVLGFLLLVGLLILRIIEEQRRAEKWSEIEIRQCPTLSKQESRRMQPSKHGVRQPHLASLSKEQRKWANP